MAPYRGSAIVGGAVPSICTIVLLLREPPIAPTPPAESRFGPSPPPLFPLKQPLPHAQTAQHRPPAPPPSPHRPPTISGLLAAGALQTLPVPAPAPWRDLGAAATPALGSLRVLPAQHLLAVLCPLRRGGERGRGLAPGQGRTPRFGVSHLVSHRGDSRARSPLGGHPRARVRLDGYRPPGCARCRCDGQWLRVSHMIRYRGAVRVRRSFGGHPRARVRTGGYPCQPVSADFAVTASRRGDGAATRPTHTPRPISTTAVGVVASLECGTGPGRSDR